MILGALTSILAVAFVLMALVAVADAEPPACRGTVEISCEDAEQLRRAATLGLGYKQQKKIAAQMEAEANFYKGRLEEARTVSRAQAMEIDALKGDLHDLEDRPTWWTVAGVGVSGVVVGIIVGVLAY